MQGAGNDFVIVDGRDGREADWAALARQACDRHFGVGADGLLLVRASARADVRMEMWNPDGSVSEMCGNGIRCFGRYVLDHDGDRPELCVETGAGVLSLRKTGESDWLQASMGKPILNGPDIPVRSTDNPVLHLAIPEMGLDLTCVSMGNPHAVHFVDDVDSFDLEHIGPAVEHHPLFPNRVNFHICRALGRDHVKMRTWERGAGLTLACGTGASATMVAARLRGLVDENVQVDVPGGKLQVSWDGQGEVLMSGPADYVFRGELADL